MTERKRRPFNKLNKAQLVRAARLIEDNLVRKDDSFVEYVNDMSDTKIAQIVSVEFDHEVSAQAVGGTRVELFGKLMQAAPPAMVRSDEQTDVTALQVEVDACHREIAELRSVLALLNDRVAFLERELGVVRQQQAA